MLRFVPPATLIGMLAFSAAADEPAKEPAKAYKTVSANQLEAVLKSMKIDYVKAAGKKEGVVFYDFERESMKVRLHNYEGKDLWIDAHFSDKIDLEDINKWNVKAKATRAVLLGSGDKATVSLESQIDCEAGVSDAIIRQFVLRFEKEMKDFVKFISK